MSKVLECEASVLAGQQPPVLSSGTSSTQSSFFKLCLVNSVVSHSSSFDFGRDGLECHSVGLIPTFDTLSGHMYVRVSCFQHGSLFIGRL